MVRRDLSPVLKLMDNLCSICSAWIAIIAKPCLSPDFYELINAEINGERVQDYLTTGDYPTMEPTPVIPMTRDATDLASSSKPIALVSSGQMQVEYNNSEYSDCLDDEKYLNIPIFPQVCSIKEKNKESSWL